jgi:hypothetical protein
MPSPSRIGTPLDIIVDMVLVNFATATFLSKGPNTGDLRARLSKAILPFSVRMTRLKAYPMATNPMAV